MIERKVQTYTTNESGQKIVTYQGQGLGERKLVIQKNGRTVSETYGVLDCTAIDYGTDLKHNDSIWNAVTRLSRGLEYTTFTHTSLANVYNSISGDVCIEFDASANTDNVSGALFTIRQDNTQLLIATRNALRMNENEWNHIKIEISDNTATITNTDNNRSVTGDVTGFNRFNLRIDANEQILFKNYMIYPI